MLWMNEPTKRRLGVACFAGALLYREANLDDRAGFLLMRHVSVTYLQRKERPHTLQQVINQVLEVAQSVSPQIQAERRTVIHFISELVRELVKPFGLPSIFGNNEFILEVLDLDNLLYAGRLRPQNEEILGDAADAVNNVVEFFLLAP